MKVKAYSLLLCLSLIGSSLSALAEGGPGLFIRNGTGTITTPVTDKTYVIDTSDQSIKYWDGVAWVAINTTGLSDVIPASPGAYTLGNAAFPWGSAYIGGSATNNTQITGTVTGARVLTLPDANSNTVIPDTGAANNFLTGISGAGIITKAQPSFSNISGTATTAQLPANQTQLTTADSLTSATSLGTVGTLTPSTPGSQTVGTLALPFSSIYIGNLATNNIQITGTGTGSRIMTLPDANSNPIIPSTAPANQFATGISSGGVISYAQPSFSNISGTATSGQIPSNTAYVDANNSWSAHQLPNAAGTIDIGSTLLPFRYLYVGGAATNNNRISSATTTAARVFTLPDADSNSVIPSTAPANQFTTGISSGGVISYAQPSFSNISGTASLTTQVSGTLPLGNGGTGQTGASDIVGTTNQVNVSGGTGKVIGGGNVTLSLPQSIASTSTPTFSSLTLTNPLTIGNGGTGANTATDARTNLAVNVFQSADQTITAAGALVLAHGLGRTPQRVWYALVNVTAELGYTTGQVVFVHQIAPGNNAGFSSIVDSTNLTIRYGSSATPFTINNATTGASATITNANWNVRFYAQ